MKRKKKEGLDLKMLGSFVVMIMALVGAVSLTSRNTEIRRQAVATCPKGATKCFTGRSYIVCKKGIMGIYNWAGPFICSNGTCNDGKCKAACKKGEVKCEYGFQYKCADNGSKFQTPAYRCPHGCNTNGRSCNTADEANCKVNGQIKCLTDMTKMVCEFGAWQSRGYCKR